MSLPRKLYMDETDDDVDIKLKRTYKKGCKILSGEECAKFFFQKKEIGHLEQQKKEIEQKLEQIPEIEKDLKIKLEEINKTLLELKKNG